jgi:hypothetical protein
MLRDIVPGLPEEIYQIGVEGTNLITGGKLSTARKPTDKRIRLPDDAMVFAFDPISSPSVAAKATDRLIRNRPSVVTVAASHWDGQPLFIEVDASGIDGPAALQLNDLGFGSDEAAGDGIHTSEPIVTGVGRGSYFLPLFARGGDGLSLYGQLEVTVKTGGGGDKDDSVPAEVGDRSVSVHVHPNPFNPVTEISLNLPAPETVRLAIYDVQGRKVRDLPGGPLPAGTHRVRWDGRDDLGHAAASGLYFLKVTAGAESAMRRLLLVR